MVLDLLVCLDCMFGVVAGLAVVRKEVKVDAGRTYDNDRS